MLAGSSVASGPFHASLDERARCHDLAAALLILLEAGGVLLRPDGSGIERFDLDPQRLREPIPCVAGSEASARRLRELVGASSPA